MRNLAVIIPRIGEELKQIPILVDAQSGEHINNVESIKLEHDHANPPTHATIRLFLPEICNVAIKEEVKFGLLVDFVIETLNSGLRPGWSATELNTVHNQALILKKGLK